MTCIQVPMQYGRAIVCVSPNYRLRLSDGGYVYMVWHNFMGPMFFRDKYERREIEEWYENPLICKALDWFIDRGEKA